MQTLSHDELIWLLQPLVSNYQPDFLNELIEVGALREFDQNWLLSKRSENELSKHKLFSACRRTFHLSYDNLLHALQ